MPTYAYACTSCDHRFEAQQSFTDDALSECPQCQGRLRKLFNSVGIVFKGSGFYRNDSRKPDSSSSSSATETKTDTKTDTKTGTKPDTKAPAAAKESSSAPAAASSAA